MCRQTRVILSDLEGWNRRGRLRDQTEEKVAAYAECIRSIPTELRVYIILRMTQYGG